MSMCLCFIYYTGKEEYLEDLRLWYLTEMVNRKALFSLSNVGRVSVLYFVILHIIKDT